MTSAVQYPGPAYVPPMTTLRELRAALASLTKLGVPSELERFETDLEQTPLDQVPALAAHYRDYVLRNSSPEAVDALTMSTEQSAAELRRKIGEKRR
jgi:hypothetical protein